MAQDQIRLRLIDDFLLASESYIAVAREAYMKNKIVSAEQAIAIIRDGLRGSLRSTCLRPECLVE